MWKTLGHDSQKKFLDIALKNKKYAHAYLFCGPAQIGKKTLAIEFANKILGSSPDAFNPDLKVLSESATINAVRALIAELALRPYQYSYKIAIIDNFEKATEEASNSLLKTFEEPNQTTIIILIATNPRAVLPTIYSRAQALYFNRLADSLIAGVLPEQNFAALFDGKIGKAIRFAGDSNFRSKLINERKLLSEIKNASLPGRLSAIKNYEDADSDELSEILCSWLDEEHFFSIRRSPEKYKNLSMLIDAIAGLKNNFNKKLVLQKLFLNIQ